MSVIKILPSLLVVGFSFSVKLSAAFTAPGLHNQRFKKASRNLVMATVESTSEVSEEIDDFADFLEDSVLEQMNAEMNQGEIDDDVTEEEEEDEATILLNFVAMLDETPSGELGEDELELLPNVMAEFMTMPGPEAAQIVEKLLFRMVNEWEAAIEKEDTEIAEILMPKATDFQMAMDAWEKSGSKDASKRIGSLFFEQQDLHSNGIESAKPDLNNIRSVLRSLSTSKDKDADRRAWSIFEGMKGYGLQPDGECYSSIIAALAKARQRGSAGRAERLLRDAVKQCPPYKDANGVLRGVSVDAFNVCITAWAKSDYEGGPQKAQDLIVLMEEVNQESGGDYLKPNVQSFTSLIDAYAQTNEWGGVRDSEGILNRLLDQYLDGEEELEPNLATWTIVMSAYNRLSRKRSRGAADRAERLLRRIEELHREGRTSYAPDNIAYRTVLNAWAASVADGAPQRAEDILNEMIEMYLDGDDAMKPELKSFRNIIDAWVKSNAPNSMEKVESLLDRFEDLFVEEYSPDDDQVGDMYKTALFGWSKQTEPLKAQEYLDLMISEGMTLDSFCFDKVIEAFTHKDADYSLKKTYEVFEQMEACRQAGTVKPNERVYTSFIRALVKAKVKGMAPKAQLVLNRMEKLYNEGNKGIKPTVFTYNAVLNACAESYIDDDEDQKKEAFKIAVTNFKDLKENREDPDHVTFGHLIKCSKLIPDDEIVKKDSFIKSSFKMCCDSGFVNSYVLRDLTECASERLWRTLLKCPSGDPEVEDLPAQWRTKFESRKKQSNYFGGGNGKSKKY